MFGPPHTVCRSGVVMIDQTKLPRQEVYVTCSNYQEVAEAIHLVRQDANRLLEVGHAPVVGDAAMGLDGESEIGRDGGDPAGDNVVGLRPIEGGVHLDRAQPLRIKAQHLRRLEAPRVEAAPPRGIGEPRCPDHELGAHGHPAMGLRGWGRP